MWSDSQTVLQWIRSDKRIYKPFVAHRVAEIVDRTETSHWRWILTKENVADDATRISTYHHFNDHSRWIRGPAFLYQKEADCLAEPVDTLKLQDDEEIRSRFVGIGTEPSSLKIERFSNFKRICRAMGRVLRFATNCLKQPNARILSELSATDIYAATLKICRQTQIEGYPIEYRALEIKKPIENSTSILALRPYMDCDGIVRLNGRTDLADVQHLPLGAQSPILLPRDHRFTFPLVQHFHQNNTHQLEDATICAIRQRYWVQHLRSLVRKVKNQCQVCKIRNAIPKKQIEGQLPVDRLTAYIHPFTYTGLDFFGPISVTIGRRKEKRWTALFTCLTIRAVHMEVAQDHSSSNSLRLRHKFRWC